MSFAIKVDSGYFSKSNTPVPLRQACFFDTKEEAEKVLPNGAKVVNVGNPEEMQKWLDREGYHKEVDWQREYDRLIGAVEQAVRAGFEGRCANSVLETAVQVRE